MRKLQLILCLLLLSSCSEKEGTTQGGIITSITIGIQPNEANRDLDTFKKEVSHRTGLLVKLFIPKDYSELVEAFKNNKIDFAFLSPVSFLQAEREGGAKALLKKVWSSDFYYSAIVTRKDEKISSLKDLKSIGFVDKKSTSGYMYPRVMLRKVGLDIKTSSDGKVKEIEHGFCGTHEKCVQALLDKKYQAVAVWANDPIKNDGAWTSGAFAGKKLPVRSLVVSSPIPNDAFAVRGSFYKENALVVYRVMQSLIDMGDRGVLKKIFSITSMSTATSRHYDSVRELERVLGAEL